LFSPNELISAFTSSQAASTGIELEAIAVLTICFSIERLRSALNESMTRPQLLIDAAFGPGSTASVAQANQLLLVARYSGCCLRLNSMHCTCAAASYLTRLYLDSKRKPCRKSFPATST
jgi:hypothetical protein